MRGCMGFGAVCCWGLWLMLISRILRESCLDCGEGGQVEDVLLI